MYYEQYSKLVPLSYVHSILTLDQLFLFFVFFFSFFHS